MRSSGDVRRLLMRHMILTAALLAAAGHAAETQTTPPDSETISRKPSIRAIPLARTLRFQPQADMTTQELEQLTPYLKGKPLHAEDEKALGSAMRHLKEVK